jgi:putative transposase
MYISGVELLQGFRFKARPTTAQAAYFARVAGCCRVLRNAALEQRTLLYQQRRISIGYHEQAGELKAAFPWLKEAPHHCLQQALIDLDAAFKRFFRGEAAYPRYHKKGQRDTFRFPDPAQIWLEERRGRRGRIKLPKVGFLSFVQHRPIVGELRSVTLSREADGWYVSILTRREVAEPARVQREAVGLDLGVAHTVALSGGRGRTSIPGATAGERTRIRRLQQKLARQKKGSRSRAKTKRQFGLLHQRIRRRRTDALHRISLQLAQNHDRVFVEALDVKAMTSSARGTRERPGRRVRQKAGLNRAILAQGWGELRRQLSYKTRWYGSEYHEVEDYAGSSQECRACHHRARENRPSRSEFVCVRCGHAAHADENAADIILARGLRVTAGGALAQSGGLRSRNLGRNLLPSEASSFRAR